MAANVYASASEDGAGGPWTSGSVTIDCPDVGNRLTDVPEQASGEVDRELALLDEQIAAAYRQLQDNAQAVRQDAGFADNAVMNPLKEKRAATIERIGNALDRAGGRPEGLSDLAACSLRTADDRAGEGDQGGDGRNRDQGRGQEQNQGQDQGQNQGQNPGQDQGQGQGQGDGQQNNGGQQGGDGQQGNGGQAGNGPVAADFTDITAVQPAQQSADPGSGPSSGTFTSTCGVNANGLFNSDNVIVAPGVSNGAHHFHDYIGNQSNDAFASDEDLANAETTCVDQGDKSTYYWPVLRLQNGAQERDANSPGGGIEGNAGKIVTPKDVTLTFVGNPRSEVTAMPRLLRIITGDAKAFVNGTANANASWSCTGFEDRQLKDKYPLCPDGSDVVRTFRFQSCWDGANIDSANHRTHVAFAAADGGCPAGFRAIPQLVQRIVYDVDAPSLRDGGRTTPLFAVDSFPEQLHKAVTDHGDFINVFDENLMNEMVDCINDGRTCGAGAGGNGNGNGNGDNGNTGNDNAGNDNGGNDNAGNDNRGNDNAGGNDSGGNDNNNNGNDNSNDNNNTGGQADNQQPPVQNPRTDSAVAGTGKADTPRTTEPRTTAPRTTAPRADAPRTAEPRSATQPTAKSTQAAPASAPAPAADGAQGEVGAPATAPSQAAPAGIIGGADSSDSSNSPGAAGSAGDAGDTPVLPAPQAQGGLADTGASLWPAAAGGLLVIGGFVVLRRAASRRH
ncbi:DUF1996 domain-containing protein [Streptomyces sp. NPDC006172]|uniref:DUF1996 domain-containing protein n=1 Tax=Streptomyces sp. NPDC006172 TaxID=3154470 RepID=UPI0033F2C561